MSFSLVIVLIFGILTLGVLVILYYINKLIIYKNKVDYAYSTILKLMDDRIDVILRIANFIENELKEESNLVKRLERLVNEYDSTKKDIKYVKKTDKYLMELRNLEKVYPKLSNKTIYEVISKEMELNLERLEYAMNTYDKEVTNYNNYVSNKYIAFLKELFKFPDYDYYSKR